MQEESQWYNWITGFHFTYFQSIMGYPPTDEEIKQAQSNWLKSEENKQRQHRNEEEKERIRLRNQKIEHQLGMNQLETPPSEKETQNSTKSTSTKYQINKKALREKNLEKETEPKLLKSTIKDIITLMEVRHIPIIGLYDQQ